MNAKMVAANLAVVVFLVPAGCSSKPDLNSLKEFQGDWEFVEFNNQGENLEAKVLRVMKVKVDGNAFRIYVNNTLGDDYNISVDSSKTPPEIDLLYASGEHQGKKELGIYVFDDNKLRLCVAGAEVPRPTHFGVTPGAGQFMMVLARKK